MHQIFEDMVVSLTKLYQLLVNKTDKETAEALTSYVEEKVSAEVKSKTTSLATKEDLLTTKEDLLNELHKVKFDMVKWYVALFTMLALLILGLYLKMG